LRPRCAYHLAMVETDARAVALLTLAFEWIRDGGFTSRQQTSAGAARDPSPVSAAAARLSDLDIEYASVLSDATADTIGTSRSLTIGNDPSFDRAEALLHALPVDPRPDVADDAWAAPFLARWTEVETAIADLVESGVTAPLDLEASAD
jgi:hypothetical protein